VLVLSRRVGERLLIAGDIVVTVIEVRGDGVRLGIDAPKDVRVHRAEVLEAVRSANAEAAAADEGTADAVRGLLAPAAAEAPAAVEAPVAGATEGPVAGTTEAGTVRP